MNKVPVFKIDLVVVFTNVGKALVHDRFYSFYYAPLAQDLARHARDLTKFQKKALRYGPLHLDEYSDGNLEPKYGPVLPMVQLMSVIPPQR